MASASRLELNIPELSVRAQNLANLLRSPDFQDKFFADPGRVALQELNIPSVTEAEISISNNLMLRLLSDPKFNSWANQFQHDIEAALPDLKTGRSVEETTALFRSEENRKILREQFAKSAIQHLAPASFADILAAGEINGQFMRAEPDIAVVPLTFIVLLVVIVALAAQEAQVQPVEGISRQNIKLAINQLNERQLSIVRDAILKR